MLPSSSSAILIGVLLTSPISASAQVKVLISGGFSGPYEKLVPEFERTSGIKVTTASGASQGTGPQTIRAQLLTSERASGAIRSGGMEPLGQRRP